MPLLSTADIADLTALDESAMGETFTITDVVIGTDAGGAQTETPTTRTVAGYLWSLSGDEFNGDQLKAVGKHRLAVSKTLTIAPTARVTQQSTGKVYQVKYVFPVTSYSTSLMIGLEDT